MPRVHLRSYTSIVLPENAHILSKEMAPDVCRITMVASTYQKPAVITQS